MTSIVVRPRPVCGWIEAVAREIRNSTGVVIGFAERVLHLTVEKPGRLSSKCQFECIAFLIAAGLYSAFLPHRRVRSQHRAWKWSVGVHRAEQIDAARAHIGRA